MFRRVAAIAAFCSSVLCLPLFAGFSHDQGFRPATPEELAMKSLPSAPGAPAVVLDWVHVDDHPSAATSEYVRIKVFTEEGKKFADVEVPYYASYPSFGWVEKIDGRTIHADGTIVPFDGKVYDKLLLKKGGRSVRAKTFTLPDVQPGSIIEYHYNSRWQPNVLPDAFWMLQKDIPVEHLRFSLTPYRQSEYSTYFTFNNLPQGKQPKKVGASDRYELELEHLAAFKEEPFALPEEMLKPRVNFYYTTSIARPEQFWTAQARDWYKEIDRFISSQNAAHLAQSIVEGETDPMMKLRKIYAYVQAYSNRSVEVAPQVSEIKLAKNADEVFIAKAGFSTDLTRAFVALARGAGFDANVVRVAPRDTVFFSDKLPDSNQMDAEIAMVTVSGSPYYFDPGTAGAPFGVVSWEKTYVPAIIMTRANGPTWSKTPADKPSAAMLSRKADLHVEGDVLAGSLTIAFRGQEALVRRQRGDDEAGRRKALESEIQHWFPNGATLKIKSIEGLTGIDDAIVVNADAQLPGLMSPAGSRFMIPLSIFATAAKNPFAAPTRENPIYFPYAYQQEDEVKLTLPEKMTLVTVPAPQAVNAGAFGYAATTKQEGNVLTFKRSFFADAMLFETAQYAPLRNFFGNVATFDQRPLVVRNPGAE